MKAADENDLLALSLELLNALEGLMIMLEKRNFRPISDEEAMVIANGMRMILKANKWPDIKEWNK